MKLARLLIAAGAVTAMAAGCAKATGPAENVAGDPAAAFADLEVPEGFIFATSRDVQLRLVPTEPGVAKYVEISDEEGRRLFAGAVLNSMDLDFDVRKGAESVLNVRVGRGADAVSQAVRLEAGVGSVSF